MLPYKTQISIAYSLRHLIKKTEFLCFVNHHDHSHSKTFNIYLVFIVNAVFKTILTTGEMLATLYNVTLVSFKRSLREII